MTCGEKIAQLRKAKGMTQEDLGKILNVTYQAVSKWERGESLPDFTTISQIAKLFNVSISYFEENGEAEQTEEVKPAAEPAFNNYIGTCTVCGKMLKEGDEYTADPKIICKSCSDLEEKNRQLAEEHRREEQERSERNRAYQAEKARKAQLGTGFDAKLVISLVLAIAGYIALTVAAFIDKENDAYYYGFLMLLVPIAIFGIVHAVCDLIDELRDKDDDSDGYTRNLSLIIGGAFAVVNAVIDLVMYLMLEESVYFIALIIVGGIIAFTFVSQFMWGGVVKDIFTAGGFTFKLPGFIFSLTIDSIIWMIVTKIFLGIIAILVFIVTTVIMAVIAMVGSVFTFIPSVISKTVKDKKA